MLKSGPADAVYQAQAEFEVDHPALEADDKGDQ